MSARRRFTAEFKARVALEALWGDKTWAGPTLLDSLASKCVTSTPLEHIELFFCKGGFLVHRNDRREWRWDRNPWVQKILLRHACFLWDVKQRKCRFFHGWCQRLTVSFWIISITSQTNVSRLVRHREICSFKDRDKDLVSDWYIFRDFPPTENLKIWTTSGVYPFKSGTVVFRLKFLY